MNDSTPAMIRWTIRFLSVVLFFLFIWLLGFVLGDIDDMDGPQRQDYYDEGIASELLEARDAFMEELDLIDLESQRQEEIKQNRREAMGVAKDTWAQTQNVHRLETSAGRQPDAGLRADLATAHERYISAQSTYEEANTKLAELGTREYSIRNQLVELEKQIKPQSEEAFAKYKLAERDHNYRLASGKLVFIVPVFLLAAWALARKRGSIYRPILKALLTASFLHVGYVMFEHFPEEFFKYIAIGAAVIIVLGFLVHSLRSAARPRPDLQLKQRREAYFRRKCPECAYPFPDEHADVFTCPSCGTGLFETCESCGGSRHHLLPFCIHCSAKAPMSAEVG